MYPPWFGLKHLKRASVMGKETAEVDHLKGAGSFHIHRKTMKELGALAVLGIQERPNLAQKLVTHRH